jgi:hypothetical protein
MQVENRLFERIYLKDEMRIPCEGIGFTFKGSIIVVGMGGIFILTEKSYSIGTVLALRFAQGDDIVEADCIVRDLSPGGMGVEFVKLRGTNEEALKRILQRMRS